MSYGKVILIVKGEEEMNKASLLISSISYILVGIIIGYVLGYYSGNDSGERQMARHILNPDFETESFYEIMGEECGSDKGWREMNGMLVFYKDGVTINGRHLTLEEKEYFTAK